MSEDGRKEKQATINIGTIGHVAHGKTTIVQAVTGVSTIRYKAELERNITIKLGYANAKIYQCECKRPECYTTSSGVCKKCGAAYKLVRHVSFVDCPGHDVLMATMLSGTAIMDGALLLVAANEPCPQPQTTEHLFAVEIMNLNRVIVVQNKIDLVTKEQAMEQHSQIEEFLKTSNASGPIVPASGQLKINIDAILDYIVNYIEEPKRNMEESARMVIIRSFDVNRPGTPTENLLGGVIGGSLVSGVIKIGDEIEVRPGLVEREGNSFVSRPYRTKIVSLKAERTPLEEAGPGGLIGVGTLLDPSICKSDKLVGMIMGLKGTLPEVYIQLEVSYELFQKTLAHSREDLRKDEQLLLNVGSTTVGANILSLSDSEAVLELVRPCCCGIGEKFAISRKHRNSWRLAGFGKIKGGKNIEIKYE